MELINNGYVSKRKARKEMKNNENKEEMQNKTSINWYKPTSVNFHVNPYFIILFI